MTTPRLCALAVLATVLLLFGLYSVLSVAPAVARDTSPTVTAISPDSGSLTGGTEVTISGSGFVGPSTTVVFGTTHATDVKVTSPGTITAIAPAHSAGSVDVTVTTTATGRGTSATDPLDLFAYGPPRVTGLSPGSGPVIGGTTVTITGSSFGPDDNVSFGTTAATDVTVISATTLVATAPPDVTTGAVDVTVSTPGNEDGTSATSRADLYAYGAPKVTSLAPETGPADTVTPVTITGTNFSPGDSVGFGATPASKVIVLSPELMTAYSPATLKGDANVTVTNVVGKSPTSVSARFAAGAPTVTGISPEAGSPGQIITITGQGFTSSDGVDFGDTPSIGVTVLSPTSLEAKVPPGTPGSVDVVVTSPQGTSASSPADLYAYGSPTVTAVTPDDGPVAGGTAVTITGTSLVSGASVWFGGRPAPGAKVNSSGTALEVSAPAGAAGSVDITVKTVAGMSAVSTADLFAYGAPVVTGDLPGAGALTGGFDVMVFGTGFVPGVTVYFGDLASSSATVLPHGTGLFAVAPPGTAGPVDITVKAPLGTSAANPDEDVFFYGPPTVTRLTPATGSAAGGTAVTISGMGFSLGSSVTFGLQRATSVTVNSPTSITAITPAADTGVIPVRVSTLAGISPINSAYNFQYGVALQSSCSGLSNSGTSCNSVDLSSVSLQGQRQETAAGITRFLALTLPTIPWRADRWVASGVDVRLSPSPRRPALLHPLQ